ncbi:hypothetical protein Tco_1094136 [Tanacetum coccineum]|uniref:Uncharacterized protein n=1 Tax=Tanacetum coccineum TaxID=301880 RepID=A0ABQ5IH68_9ASTR
MSIPDSMMNDAIKSSTHYMTYLALSTNTKVPKATKGKGKDPDEAVKLAQSISKTEAEEEERRLHETHARLVTKKVVDIAESDETEDDEIQSLIRRATGVVIDKEIPKESTKEALDHYQKLKGIETLSAAAQLMPDLKTTTKASRLDYRIQQQSQGSSEGAGIIPEVLDEPKDISGSSSSSISGLDNETKDISSDEEVKADEHKADEGKDIEEQAGDEQKVDEQARGDQAKVQVPDLVIQSMVDVPVHQEDPAVQRTPLVDTLEQRLSELEKKVEVLSKVDHADVIEESIQANVFNEVKNQLPKLLRKAVSDFVKPRMERTVRELKNMLYYKMQQSGSFLEHHKYLDLYNARIGSIGLDEAIKGEIDPAKVLKKRCCDDKDEDPPAKSDKEKKRGKQKDFEPSKDDQAGSSKKGNTPSKSSNIDKSVNAEETIEEPVQEVAMDVEEPVDDEQDARLETPNPEWHKVPNGNDAPEQTWFHELVNADKNPLTFDNRMGSTVDFIKFAMHRLKKDKITKADLEGPAYNLLKGTCRNNIELECNLEQCYIALSDKLDWTNPEGDICPFNLSKPLPFQYYQGQLVIHVNFFFNNDLKYLKTGNKDRKYALSLTKSKAARYDLVGIEEMILRLWSSVKEVYDKNVELGIHH